MLYRIRNTATTRIHLHQAAAAMERTIDLQTRYNPDNATFTVCETCVRGGSVPVASWERALAQSLQQVTLADVVEIEPAALAYRRPCIICEARD